MSLAEFGTAPAADTPQALCMQHGCDDGAAVLQRLHDMLLRGAQRIKVSAAAQRPRAQQDLGQGGRVRQALQHTVHEAGVAQVLQPSALRSRCAESAHAW